MKVVIPGGSGQVGTILARAFHRLGDDVVVLSRRPATQPWRVVKWDGSSRGDWQRELDGCDAVINLVGRSVNCRYTAANRREILQSRVVATRLVGKAIADAARPPAVWLQASTATIYAHRFDAPNDEYGRARGRRTSRARHVAIQHRRRQGVGARVRRGGDTPHAQDRAAIGTDVEPGPGGIFDTLLGLVRRGLGGPAGRGDQFVSWVHEEDFVAVVRWLIDRNDIHGIVNVAAPHPLPNAEFMRVLRDAWGASFGLPASRWMLEIGAVFMRTETELILKSRRVVPTRLLEKGFTFAYPHWRDAAGDLCRRWRIAHDKSRAA